MRLEPAQHDIYEMLSEFAGKRANEQSVILNALSEWPRDFLFESLTEDDLAVADSALMFATHYGNFLNPLAKAAAEIRAGIDHWDEIFEIEGEEEDYDGEELVGVGESLDACAVARL